MKKIISILLAMLLVASLAACGGNKPAEKPTNSDKVVEMDDTLTDGTEETEETPDETSEKEETKKEETKKEETKKEESEKEEIKKGEDKKPATAPITKPEQTPAAKPEAAPEVKPEQTAPETKPETAPETKPETEKAPATLGNTLLADFKTKASKSTLEIAEGLMQNEAILFAGGAMEVEPGLLSGFGNTEITGFKSGAVFMPMIGSIAFVGYIFELENAADVPAFISKLKSSADMRWNICVEAEEMVTGSVGNKVFFVMCPKTLEE